MPILRFKNQQTKITVAIIYERLLFSRFDVVLSFVTKRSSCISRYCQKVCGKVKPTNCCLGDQDQGGHTQADRDKEDRIQRGRTQTDRIQGPRQCGNFRILLSFRFYVKSAFENSVAVKMHFAFFLPF